MAICPIPKPIHPKSSPNRPQSPDIPPPINLEDPSAGHKLQIRRHLEVSPCPQVGREAHDAPVPHLSHLKSNPKFHKNAICGIQILHPNHCSTKSIHASQLEPQRDSLKKNQSNPLQLQQEDSFRGLAPSGAKDLPQPQLEEEEEPSSKVPADFVLSRECIKKSGDTGKVDAKRSWADVVRGPGADKVVVSISSEECHKNRPWVPAGEIKSSLPQLMHHGQSERNLAFKIWARGRCYRCLARDHQVRSCKNSFRCIRCLRFGHRERHCHLQGPSFSPQGQTLDRAFPLLAQSHNQSQESTKKIVNPADHASLSSTHLDANYTVTSLLELKLFETHLKEMIRPIKEELSTIKLWLARVATKLDCHEQDNEHASFPSFAGLFGPCSPVRASTSTLLDSLVAAHDLVDPSERKNTTGATATMSRSLDWENGVEETSSVVTSSCTAEKNQEKPWEQPIEIPMNTCTTQEDEILIQTAAQVEDTIPGENASTVMVVPNLQITVEGPIEDGPVMPIYDAKVEEPFTCKDLAITGSSSSDFVSTIRVYAGVPSPSPTTAAGCRRKPYGKSYHQRSRLAQRNILKDLGILMKNGKLNEGKIEEYADFLQKLLPLDLRLSLMKLEEHDFWEVLTKVISLLC